MAGGYDGHVRIDSSIDTKGFNVGMKKLGDVMRKALAGMLKAGLGTVLIVIGLIVAAIAAVASAIVGAALATYKWAEHMTKTLQSFLAKGSLFRDQVDGLAEAFMNVKGSILSVGATLLSALAPILMTVIDWIVRAINYVNMFIAALTGQKQAMQYVAGSAKSTADATGKAAKNTKKIGEAAEGALAAFDELNVLEMAKDSGGGGGGTGQLVKVDVDSNILKFIEDMKARLAGAWEWVKTTVADVWNWIVGLWTGFSTWFVDTVWTPVVTWFTDNVITPLKAKWDELKVYFAEFWTSVMQPAIDWIVQNVWPVFEWIGTKLWDLLRVTLPATFQFFWGVVKSVFTWVIDLFKNVWLTIVGVVKGIMTSLEGVLEFLTGVFTGNWSKAWDGIKRIFSGVWESIVSLSKGFVNLIIDTVNALIRAVASGLNAMIGAMNQISVKIPEWVPKYGGSTFGLSIPEVKVPQIPRLATGAVIPPNARFLAMLGDQSRGTNVEAPEELIRKIVREETEGIGAREVTINFAGSLGALVRELKPYIDKESTRIGGSLISGGIV